MTNKPTLPENVENAIDTTMFVLHRFGLTHDEIHDAIIDSRINTIDSQFFNCRLLLKQCFEPDSETTMDVSFTAHPTEVIYEILLHSRNGIQSDKTYWNDVPQYDLCDTLTAYGYHIEFQDKNGDEYTEFFANTDELEFDIVLSQEKHDKKYAKTRTRFSYPDTKLDMNNYPALINHVNVNHLSHRDVEYVLLKPRDEKWTFALIEKDKLDVILDKFGEQITVFGEPLLSQHMLEEYTNSTVPSNSIDDVKLNTQNTDIGETLTTDKSDTVFRSASQLVQRIVQNDGTEETTKTTNVVKEESETSTDEKDEAEQESDVKDETEKPETDTKDRDGETTSDEEEKSLTQRILGWFK